MRALCAVLLGAAAVVGNVNAARAQTIKLRSPDQRNLVTFSISNGGPAYSVSRDGRAIIAPSSLGIVLDAPEGPPSGKAIGGTGFTIASSSMRSAVEAFTRPAGKSKQVNAAFREAEVTLRANEGPVRTLKVQLRAFDDGIAFRYVVPAQPGLSTLAIIEEQTSVLFPADFDCWGLNIGRLKSGFEGEHDKIKASLIRPAHSYQ